MNVVDSSGWVEYFIKGENGPIFLPVIQDTQNLIVPTICIYEVFKRMIVLAGAELAFQVAGVMSEGQEAALDSTIAIEAANISVEAKLSMADSIILATARSYQATLWTQDAHFKDLPEVRYIEKLE